MNEVQKIHISRQAYTIAVDAYGELKKYLDALQKKIDDTDVYKEIELRIVELLSEHGVSDDKVILKEDVAYLKENLGELSEFESNETDISNEKTVAEETDLPRRFMRNPRGQMLGGVANGLASYFGVDPIWARLSFIVLTLASGFGVVLYLILWAIMPEAKTSSDFIQMQGKPVTIDSITEFAESRKVEEGVHRIGIFIANLIRLGIKVLLCGIAFGLVTVGVIGIIGSIAGAIFLMLGTDQLFSGVQLFPVTNLEVAAVITASIAGVTASVFMLISGMGILARKWQLPTWATASLVTLFFVSLFTAAPLFGVSVPRISKRVDDAYATQTRQVGEFQKLQVTSYDNILVSFEPSNEYSVSTRLFGEKDASLISSKIEGETLMVDADKFNDMYRCYSLCLYPTTPELIVRGPSLSSIMLSGPVNFESLQKLPTQQLEVINRNGAEVFLANVYPESLTYFKHQNKLMLEGLRADAVESDKIYLSGHGSNVRAKRAIKVNLADQESAGCDVMDQIITLGSLPGAAIVNSTDVLAGISSDIGAERTVNIDSQQALSHCMMVDSSMY